jgi:ubiquinone/menaquinone biosynthesis C-methylase UbiE
MHDRRFKPSEVHKLEDPERLIWLPPSEVLTHLSLQPGMNIADVGAGTGFFAIPMARAVAPNGKVFAVDVEPEMLEKLKQKLTALDAPQNIEVVEGEASKTHLAGGCADLVLMANVWHEVDPPPRAAVLREATRLLCSGGRLAILDWRSDVDRPPGPPLEHRIAGAQVSEFLRSRGWMVKHSSPVGRYSYLIVSTPVRS